MVGLLALGASEKPIPCRPLAFAAAVADALHIMEQRTADRTPDTGQDAAPPDTLSAREAADVLGVHERTIRRAIARGELTADKQAGIYRIAPHDLARYRAQRRVAGSIRHNRPPAIRLD